MANELVHGSVGTELTQAEWEGVGTHVFNSQATGDIVYASSSSQLSRLAKGTDTHVLILSSGIPAWSTSTGITALGTIATGVWQGTDVGVAYGGTGVSTLTDGGILLGSGASAITAMAVLTDGQMIVGDGTTDPVAESGADLRTSIGVGTSNSVQFAGITGTTIDATTDFTIGDTVITNGVITDSSGLQIAADVDLASNDLLNVGGSGNDWSATAFTHDGGATFNESGGNYDFRVEGDTNANMIFVDASRDVISFGTAPSADIQFYISNGALVITDDTNFSRVHMSAQNPVVVSSGTTSAFVSTLTLEDPWVTTTGTATNVSVLRITDGPGAGTNRYAIWVDGNGISRLNGGVIIGDTTSLNNLIDDTTTGSGTTTLYVGNASITVSSDERLKTDIRPTAIKALSLVDEFKVVDFGWDDPTDTVEYGKNYRGRYTGMLAQDAIKIAPWIINDQGGGRDCSQCMSGDACDDHGMWQVEYQHLVPTLVKAIQELSEKIQALGV